MNNLLGTKSIATNKKTGRILLMGMVVVTLIVAQDFLRASVKGCAFYSSESLMFSAFWWIFAPLLLAQYTFVKRTTTTPPAFFLKGLSTVIPVMLHLVMFPWLVWLLSSTFYYHTFAFEQTLRYALSEHLYLILVVYATPIWVYPYYRRLTNPDIKSFSNPPPTDNSNPVIQALLVSDGGKKRSIPIQQIAYFTALPPYIAIHTDEKMYLYTETLKSIATRLPDQQFARIHKSTIVNINQVASYTSRLTGDYDLVLSNKVTLRVSRNFAAQFRHLFQERQQLATD